ncbi:disulfide bond formation protein B [Parahaliea mediterranea]|uniref:Disulfide bond formation protein B n=1 Tax=Parahaliea mediterranea TaxID=651086 RepID=A0A939IN69_9GAMM|nr:disulfide bond formation protein B [Parahaliea mediterranea]MBN7798255.1 disulfide bond formation protein B [Parahaliea mediterranea]
MLQTLSPRLVFFGLALLALVSMLFAYFYLQQHLGLAPCPLCMTQRVAVVALGVFALLAALHNPTGNGRRIYAALCAVAATFGAAIAGRHVWLQYLPEDQVPACGPSLEYMLETLPFAETVKMVMMGDGNCAETMWTFLGLSIPEQTLGLFLVLLAISLWQLLRTAPRS